jgi:hypothetical protein
MIGPINEVFALADMKYRHDRAAMGFPRSSRPFHFKWPTGLRNPNRRGARRSPGVRPAPHHVTSIS